jgi:hypothetical protein
MGMRCSRGMDHQFRRHLTASDDEMMGIAFRSKFS